MPLQTWRRPGPASLAMLLLAVVPALCQTAVPPSGSGTAADPYRIAVLGHLVWMADNVAFSGGKHYALQNDIDATATATWNDPGTDTSVLEGFRPIGTSGVHFTGQFDGQGYSIHGLTIRRPRFPSFEVGLFGHIGSSAVVRRLGLEGGSVFADSAVGALVGINDGGLIEQCHASVAVTGEGQGIIVGGLVGENLGTLRLCYASGTVRGQHYWAGGLVGSSDAGTIERCYATGDVTGEWHVGGLAGASLSAVTDGYATGAVIGQRFVGGLLGSSGGSETGCYATGAVTGIEQVGGLVGSHGGTATRCYARGAVTGQTQVGGLVGLNLGTIRQGYATGAVAGQTQVGGLVGRNDGTVEQSYWDTETTGWMTSAGGEGKTSAQMREESTYALWDFAGQWGIAPGWNDGYPYPLQPGSWRVRFVAGPNGRVAGAASQVVPDGEDAAPATAVPAYLFVFARWDDGPTENPRTLTGVTADTTLTASFRPADPRPADGAFLAEVTAASSGWWDLTGIYTTTLKTDSLTLALTHDPSGRVSGTATYALAKDTTVTMPIRGCVRGSGGSITMKGSLRGSNSVDKVTMELTLDVTVDTANRQLVGRMTGTIKANGTATPVNENLVLAIPGSMDGTWTLSFDLDRSGRNLTGTALLKLSNGVQHTFIVRGRTSLNGSAVLTASGSPADPTAKAISISTTITPLEGNWARLERFAARGYGHVVGW